MAPVAPIASYLRVYEPLAAFAEDERAYWEAYARAGSPPGRAEGPVLERLAGLRAAATLGTPGLPVVPEHAFVTEVDGVTLLCPWRTALRASEAVVEGGAEDRLLGQPGLAEAAGEVLSSWDYTVARSHILTSGWHVPARWFVLVGEEERSLRLDATVRTGRELVYRTPMSRARRRVARALAVLRRTVDRGAVTEGVEDLGRWLEEFHPRSLVELDYGGLVQLLDDTALQTDASAADVAQALAALSEGHPGVAAAAYGRVLARMRGLQAVETAS